MSSCTPGLSSSVSVAGVELNVSPEIVKSKLVEVPSVTVIVRSNQDVLSCKRFPDAIANGTYHIDVHDPKTGKFKFLEPRGDFYQIPLSTMVSDKTPNIVLAIDYRLLFL